MDDLHSPFGLRRRQTPRRPPLRDSDLPGKVFQSDRKGDSGRIRCPVCGWRPTAWDRWMCTCGCVWNTFETRALCPDCGKQWTETICLSCRVWSRHEDWYSNEGTDTG